MAVLTANVLTMLDHAKRLDPNGSIAAIAELLLQRNPILQDLHMQEGNLITGHRSVLRTGDPSVYWRRINIGTTASKSTTAQIEDHAATLEGWSQVDAMLAELGGDKAAFLASEGKAFVAAMSNEVARVLFYGNAGLNPEQFTGLSARYASTTVTPAGPNVLLASSAAIGQGAVAGTDNNSIWLIVWGPDTVFGVFPKGSKVGIQRTDYGKIPLTTSASLGGTMLEAYVEKWSWSLGLVVRDWRYAVRVANLRSSLLTFNAATGARITNAMILALHRIPDLNAGRAAFYMNRSIFEYLDFQRLSNVSAGGGLTYENVDGRIIPHFRGIPVRVTDALVESAESTTVT